jgi:hypothetical protein
MTSPLDKTPEKVRIKDSYRERVFAESQQLGKSYLETLYFIIDCYFAFKHGAFPIQQLLTINSHTSPSTTPPIHDTLIDLTSSPSSPPSSQLDSSDTFSLDWDL